MVDIESLRVAAEEQRARAGASYRMLLLKGTLSKSDESQMLTALQILGKQIADVADDAALIEQADRCVSTIAQANEIGLFAQEKRKMQAQRELEAWLEAARAALFAEHRERAAKLAEEFAPMVALGSAARAAAAELSKLLPRLKLAFTDATSWAVKLEG